MSTDGTRRSETGEVCGGCGSGYVRCVWTHTEEATGTPDDERKFRRVRRLVCLKCGREWERTLNISESFVFVMLIKPGKTV